jgi:urease accessory protein
LRQSGALKLLFPRRADDVHAILINTAGGITGGDRFDISGKAGADTRLTISTQAAERVYRAQPHQTGRVHTNLRVQSGARLNWVPQETILFDGCALHRSLSVDLDEGAEFLMVEPVIFGRRAMGEELRDVRFDDRVSIRRAGDEIYRDGVHIWGDAAAQMDRPAIGGGARAMASLVLARPGAETQLPTVRDIIGTSGGASMLATDLLVVRLLAADGFELRRRLLPLLDHLTENALPNSWRL